MGSYTFKWAHPAEEVFVTGTFDDWKKSTQLEKVGEAFEKRVELPKSDDKILYKFVADGDWKHDPTAKTEQDHDGNTNNVLYPDDLESSSLAGAAISSVGPGATTTEMAGEQPVEKSTSPPGAFPETPAADDDQTFSVNPIPATEGAGNPVNLAPGEPVPDSATVTDNTLSSGVHDDPELKSKDAEGEQTFGVAPIPATGGIGNPVQLAPGEKVPDSSTLTSNTVESTATTDQASYEKSDASAPTAQPSSGTQDGETPAGAVFGTLGGPGPVIPESGMAMGDSSDINKEDTGPTTSSVAPGATTTELAGQQPIEPRGTPTVKSSSEEDKKEDPTISSVTPEATTAGLAGEQPIEPRGEPTVIGEDQEEAKNGDPTISSVAPGSTTADLAGEQPIEERGSPEVVSEGPPEAKSEPEAPSTSKDGIGAKVAAGVAAGGVAAAGGAVAANELIKDKTGTDVKSALPESVQNTVDEKAKDSEVPEKSSESTTDAAREITSTVPAEVTESQKEAGEPAEAAAVPEAVQEKSEMEKELLSKVPESEATGEPAPTESAAAATSAPAPTSDSGAPQPSDSTAGVAPISMDDKPEDKQETPLDSRDVSPMSKSPTQQEPLVTSGIATTSAPKQSAAQDKQSLQNTLKSYKTEEGGSASSTPSKTTDTSAAKKKENRRSFFGRIKDKLK